MATKKEDKVSIDLSCKQTQEKDTLTKDGQRTIHTALYNGDVQVEDSVVTAVLQLKSDDKGALEQIVPLMVGSRRQMDLSLTNEDLDNHPETQTSDE